MSRTASNMGRTYALIDSLNAVNHFRRAASFRNGSSSMSIGIKNWGFISFRTFCPCSIRGRMNDMSDWKFGLRVYSGIDMGARRMFFHLPFFPEKDDALLVVALKTHVLTVTGNAENTLQHSQRGEVPLKHGSNTWRESRKYGTVVKHFRLLQQLGGAAAPQAPPAITGSAVALHCCKAHAKSNRKMGNSTPVKS